MPCSAFSRVAVNAQLQLYYKAFLPRSPLERLKSLLRGSRATRARRNGDALRDSGIEAPLNVIWGPLPGGREYLYTVALAGRGVDAWLRDLVRGSGADAMRQRRRLLEDLGVFVGRLHASGFVHGDLRPGNIVARREYDRFRFALLDNERNRRLRPPPGRLLLRNLMQLNMLPLAALGHTDRMRFFRAWRRQLRDYTDLEAKVLGAEAYRWAMRRIAQRQHR